MNVMNFSNPNHVTDWVLAECVKPGSSLLFAKPEGIRLAVSGARTVEVDPEVIAGGPDNVLAFCFIFCRRVFVMGTEALGLKPTKSAEIAPELAKLLQDVSDEFGCGAVFIPIPEHDCPMRRDYDASRGNRAARRAAARN